jgi:hypothetical protein
MAGFQLFNGKGNCNSCHVDGRSTLLSPNIADNWRPASRKSRLSPDTIKGYIELSSAGQKKDLLGAKIRELIALAVAVTARCDGCITSTPKPQLRMVRPRKRLRKHWASQLR